MTYEEALKVFAIGIQKMQGFDVALRYKRAHKQFEVEFRSPGMTVRHWEAGKAMGYMLTNGVTMEDVKSLKPMPEVVMATQKLLGGK